MATVIPPVLERAGGVGALDLQQAPGPHPGREPGRGKQRGAPLAPGDHRRGIRDRKELAVLLDDPPPTDRAPDVGHRASPTMRMTPPICSTVSSSASARRVARTSPSRATWVT